MEFAACDLEVSKSRLRLLTSPVNPATFHYAPHWQRLCQSDHALPHSHSETGRPVLRDCTDDISISHTEESANRYVYLLGQTKEPLRIGVDVECRRRHISNALASRLKLMNKMAEPIVTWVLTEAFCKCLDEPLAIGSFLIRSKGLREGWNLWSFHPRNEPLKELQVEGFSKIEGDYALAVALTLPGGEANGASD